MTFATGAPARTEPGHRHFSGNPPLVHSDSRDSLLSVDQGASASPPPGAAISTREEGKLASLHSTVLAASPEAVAVGPGPWPHREGARPRRSTCVLARVNPQEADRSSIHLCTDSASNRGDDSPRRTGAGKSRSLIHLASVVLEMRSLWRTSVGVMHCMPLWSPTVPSWHRTWFG